MRDRQPFRADDLADLDERILSRATAVVTMREVYEGKSHPHLIGLRHDVDDNPGSLDTALELARWEHEQGYRASFYMLHTAPYWQRSSFGDICEEIESYGHEIGLHVNAIAHALLTGEDPRLTVLEALAELREHVTVTSVVAHGDNLCHVHGFVNDEMFKECARPTHGAPARYVGGTRSTHRVKLKPVEIAYFGVDFVASWLPRGQYLSDSGGSWCAPGFNAVAAGFPYEAQLHMLIHPDWWYQAFGLLRQEAA